MHVVAFVALVLALPCLVLPFLAKWVAMLIMLQYAHPDDV